MPSKKKKYNARFPPARIKKIMQKDEDVGKVAAPVPVLISKALEIFVESLITKSSQQTLSRNAKTLTTSHIKQCIELESKFDFLKDLVENVPTISCEDEESNNSGSCAESKHGNARFGSSRKKPSMSRDASAQSSIQSVDEPSTEEDSEDSDDPQERYESKRPPAEDRSASTSRQETYSVPRHNHSISHNLHPPGAAFPQVMPSTPHQLALSGSTLAMGTYIASQQTRNNEDNDDSDDDYDA